MTTANVNITKVLLKRGNTTQNDNYTGVFGEITVDTQVKTLRIHDGVTVGGNILTASGAVGSYSNVNTAAYLTSQSITSANIGAFQTLANANAASQTTEINSLRSNITAANAAITSLQSNAAIQAALLDTLTGNAATQSTVLDTLTSNAAAQATSLTTLLSNAVAQQTSLIDLVANAATQAQAIASVTGTYSNANVASYLTAFNGNILPSANVTYSLGDATHQWRDLWVSNNTIYIGNVPLTVNNGNLLVNGSLVTGSGSGTDDVLRANVGSFYAYANLNYGTSSYANANVAGYLASQNITSANIGAYQTFANANAATQSTAIATLQTQVYSNTNVAAYIPTYTGALSSIANITLAANGEFKGPSFQTKKLSTVTLGATINNYVEFLTVGGGWNGGYSLMLAVNNNLAGTNTQTNKIYIVTSNYGSYGNWQVVSPVSETPSAGQSGAWELLATQSGGSISFRLRNKTGFAGTSLFSINVYNLDGLTTAIFTQSSTTGTDATAYTLSGGSPLMIIGANTVTGTGRVAVATPYAVNNSTFTVGGNAYVSGNITTIANVIAPNYLFANGVNILSTAVGTYSNTNVNTYLSSGIIGSLSTSGNLTVGGNLIVNGNSTIINTTSYTIEDNILQIADGNPADTLDLGLVGHRTVNSTLQHTGLIRDASAGNWKLFSNVTSQPGNTVDFTDAVYDDLVVGNISSPTVTDLYANAATQATSIDTINNTLTSPNVAIGYGAGATSQGGTTVAVGSFAGMDTQGLSAVAVGFNAGQTTQGIKSVAIGMTAGYSVQGNSAVAIGDSAGYTSQGLQAIAIGKYAGLTSQSTLTVAVGSQAGETSQGIQATAVGSGAGNYNQSAGTVAIGTNAGAASQGLRAVAVGSLAGSLNQGEYAVALGNFAGGTDQGNNSIIINATGSSLDQTTANTFTVAPVRNDVANVAQVMFYNTTSKEITYGNTINIAGNINAGQFNFANGVNILSTVGAGAYGNTQVAAYLANYDGGINFTASPAVITGLGNISSANFTFANGVNILSTVTATANTGNITFSDTTIGTSGGAGQGIILNSAGSGEIAMLDYVGINNTNPGYWLHVGDGSIGAINNTGNISIDYNNGLDSSRATTILGYAWWDAGSNGNNNRGIGAHRQFGIYKNDDLYTTKYIEFDLTSGNANLTNIAVTRVTTTNGIFWANGVSILDGITGGGGTTYTDANVVSLLAANTAVFVGNTNNVNTYSLQSNITQVFIGGNAAIASGNAATTNSTSLLHNMYFAANGTRLVRNTGAGVGTLSFDPTGFTVSGLITVQTANSAPALPIWMKANTNGAYFPSGLTTSTMTASGTVTVGGSGIQTSLTTFPLVNQTATTINFGGAATTINMGSGTIGGSGSNVFVGNAIGTSSGNLTVRAFGTYNSVNSLTSSGGYGIATYSNIAVTGGSGTGMIISMNGVASGYLGSATVTNPGTGYRNGETITIPAGNPVGSLGGSFVIGNYNAAYLGQVLADYSFGIDGNLRLPGNVTIAGVGSIRYANGVNILSSISTLVATNFSTANAVITGGYATGVANITLTSGGNISGVGNIVGSTANTTITAGAYTSSFLSNGVVTTTNVVASGNVTADYFSGNGSQLAAVATQVTGSWTLAAGANSVNFTVPANGTYSMWVRGNVPNGICVWTATAVITNTNVPVIGNQYAWYYLAGNALELTSIPAQIIGTAGSISNAAPSVGTTTNVFEFGITNNSGSSQTVYWGYTKL